MELFGYTEQGSKGLDTISTIPKDNREMKV